MCLGTHQLQSWGVPERISRCIPERASCSKKTECISWCVQDCTSSCVPKRTNFFGRASRLPDQATDQEAYKKPKVQKMTEITGLCHAYRYLYKRCIWILSIEIPKDSKLGLTVNFSQESLKMLSTRFFLLGLCKLAFFCTLSSVPSFNVCFGLPFVFYALPPFSL